MRLREVTLHIPVETYAAFDAMLERRQGKATSTLGVLSALLTRHLDTLVKRDARGGKLIVEPQGRLIKPVREA